MEKKPDALFNLFVKFCTGFSKDSSDCLSTLSTSLEFLRVCISLDEEESELGLPPRTLVMSVQELALVLGWKKTESEDEDKINNSEDLDKNIEGDTENKDNGNTNIFQKKHPIYCLEKLLLVCDIK